MSHYETVEVGAVVRESFGGGTPRRKSPEFWDGDIAWTRSSYIDTDGSVGIADWITEAGLAGSSANLVPDGALLVGTRVGVGKVGITERPMAISQDLTGLVVDSSKMDPTFMMYALKSRSVQDQFQTASRGSTIKGVPRTDLLSFQIPIPSLPEQRAIARILRTVQQAQEATEQVIDAARELKRSLMEHLFTYGPVPVGRAAEVSVAATEIGPMPDAWTVELFDDVVDIRRGQVDPTVSPYREMIHVGPDNIESGSGHLEADKTAGELNLISGKYLFDADDVLYSKIRPYLRKAALPDFTGVCSADMYPVTPKNDRLRRGFLYQYLLSDEFTKQATSYQSRTGIPKINRQQLGGIPTPVPPLKTQATIEASLAAVDTKIRSEEDHRHVLDALLSSLLSVLMSGRLRVPESMLESAA